MGNPGIMLPTSTSTKIMLGELDLDFKEKGLSLINKSFEFNLLLSIEKEPASSHTLYSMQQ